MQKIHEPLMILLGSQLHGRRQSACRLLTGRVRLTRLSGGSQGQQDQAK